MKKMILILVVVLMSLATSVSAQNYSEVMDNLRLEGLQTFGNNINGSWSYLNSGAGFKITDYGCRRSAAEGEAEGFGLLKADGEIKDDFLRLKSLAITKTSARQLKGDHGEIDLDGFVQRANYGTLEKGDNFITG